MTQSKLQRQELAPFLLRVGAGEIFWFRNIEGKGWANPEWFAGKLLFLKDKLRVVTSLRTVSR